METFMFVMGVVNGLLSGMNAGSYYCYRRKISLIAAILCFMGSAMGFYISAMIGGKL